MGLKLLLIAICCFQLSAALNNTRYYPRYHLAPVSGWMNDPNGFCIFEEEYQLCYQYNPDSSFVPGTARWGHAKSKDLFHWENVGIAMQNDSSYDKNGVFSGSALVLDDVMYVFYTGQVKLPDETPDQNETQELAISTDGVTYTKYENNPIIVGEDLQPNIRDPKVWIHNGTWYMVLGNSFVNDNNETLGRILLFKSSDKITWVQVSVLAESDGFLGYMFECPDFFELDGKYVLLFSPQGVKPLGDRFRNLYQTGYIVGYFDYTYYVFTPITEFRELDCGHDFYATQSLLDSNGRRLSVGWMDMWETSYPESEDGFHGQMTLFRVLTLTDDLRVKQTPVKEVTTLRGKLLFEATESVDSVVSLTNRTGEVLVNASRTEDFTMYIGNSTTSRVKISYEFEKGRVSLRRDDTDDGLRRTLYRPLGDLIIRVFIDASSVEVFFGGGLVTFSSRFFLDGTLNVYFLESNTVNSLKVYHLNSSLYS